MKSRLERAAAILEEEKVSCVILSAEGKKRVSSAIGIKPLMTELRADREAFLGCVIADRVIGKAAALMALLGKAEAVYGKVMSQDAKTLLDEKGMYCEYGELVPYIENRTKTGRCPMEETVLFTESPEEAFDALEITIARLMAQK